MKFCLKFKKKNVQRKKTCVSQNNTIINDHSGDCKNANFKSQLHIDRASRSRSLTSEQVSEREINGNDSFKITH